MGMFATELKELMKKHRISMGMVARALGVSVPYVSQVVNGHRPPFTDDHYDSLTECFPSADIDTLRILAASEREALAPWENRTTEEETLLTELSMSRKRRPEGHLDPETIKQILRTLKPAEDEEED